MFALSESGQTDGEPSVLDCGSLRVLRGWWGCAAAPLSVALASPLVYRTPYLNSHGGLAVPAFVIGESRFPTKKAATNAVRSVLYRYPPGSKVNDTDSLLLLDLLKLHRHAEQKIGCGVAYFTVEQYPWNVGFGLTRVDGSKTDWSYVCCITPPSKEKEARAGFRTEISEQIKTFRNAVLSVPNPKCAITGVPLVNDLTTHIDHNPRFEVLLADFLASKSLQLEDVETNATEDNDLYTTLLDRSLAEEWKNYHRKHAVLRAVTKPANLSQKRGAV